MAKATSKKPRLRLKKQVKRTIGGIFLASAVAVAAIPAGSRSGGNVEASPLDATIHPGDISGYCVTVDDVLGNDRVGGNVITNPTGNIPQINTSTKIYTDESKAFEFAYVQDNNNQYVAVIVGYGTLSLEGGTLTIPETFDAYTQYNTNSTNGQLCAVGKSGNFLFYPKAIETAAAYEEVVEDPSGAFLTDDAGRTLYTDSVDYYTDNTNAINTFYQETDELNQVSYINSVSGAVYGGDPGNLRPLHVTKVVNHEAEYDTTFVPCYLDNLSEWAEYSDYDLYYDVWHTDGSAPAFSVKNDDYDSDGNGTIDGNDIIYKQCANDTQFHRIKAASVAYISNQYAERNAATGVWSYHTGNEVTSANPSKGIFANNANISTLIIKGTLVGIGDYAFYSCSGLTSLDLSGSNGLQVIGPGAFSDCYQLSNVTFTSSGAGTNLKRIGEKAFCNCRSIRSIVLPKSVTTLGDSCFEGCVKINNLDLCGGGDGGDASLTNIGVDVFKDCQSVTTLVFPWNAKGMNKKLLLSEFKGCDSLASVSVRNEDLSFEEEPGYFTYDTFKEQQGTDNPIVSGKFYFEGFTTSDIHTMCMDNCFAFHYITANDYQPLTPDIYELKVDESEGAGTGYVTYQVNVNNELQFPVKYEGVVETLSFPEHIGPYHISTIAPNAFQNMCTLERISVPSTVTSIGAGAFRGCHNIKYVIFGNDNIDIGSDAFKTQDFTASTHSANCPSGQVETEADNSPTVKLTFVGPIDANSTPYRYAMNSANNYNNGQQAKTYIQCCTGWPTFITVCLQGEDLDGDTVIDNYYSELIDFPTIATLADYTAADYLTDAQRAAAAGASTAANPTEDQKTFLDAATSLTIPTGVDRIKDGLYYNKTENVAAITSFPVKIMDIKKIEAKVNELDKSVPANKNPEGLFIAVDPANSDFAGCSKLTSLTIYGGAQSIDDYGFYGCDNLSKVSITSPDITSVGNYAFGDCDNLAEASISNSVNNFGKAPFVGDEKLETLELNNSGYYKVDSQVLYKLTDGNPTEIVEVLPARNTSLRSDAPLTTVTTIDEDAFSTSQVGVVDLSKTVIGNLGTHAFHNAKKLSRVILPPNCTTVGKYVFEDSTVGEVSGGTSVVYPPAEFLDGIWTDANGNNKTNSTTTTYNPNVTVYAPNPSNLYTYAVSYDYNAEADLTPAEYTVNFYGYDSNVGTVTSLVFTQSVTEGFSPSSANAIYNVVSEYTDAAGRKYIMDGWETSDRTLYTNAQIDAYPVDGDVDFFAHYILADTTYYTVVFNDYYGQPYKTFKVIEGDTLADEQLDIPVLPDIVDEDGIARYNSGWNPDGTLTPESPITRDVTFNPIYSKSNGPYSITLQYSDPTDGNIKVITTIAGITKGSDATSNISLVSIPAFEGYVFAGWEKAIIVPDGASYTNVTTDMVLTGSYIDNVDGPYSVTLQYTDPTTNTNVVLQVLENVVKGSDISGQVSLITPPSFKGYVFNGWDKSIRIPDGADLTNVTGNYILTGTYVDDVNGPYTVTLQYNDPTDNTIKQLQVLQNVLKGSDISGQVSLITPPTFPGYNFNGWQNAIRVPEEADLTNVTGNYVLTGQYVMNTNGPFKITVQYKDPSDGTIKELTTIDNVEAGSDVTSKVMVMSPPDISGYNFDGWDNAIISPNGALLSNVTMDIAITGTYSAKEKEVPTYNGEDADIIAGNAFYAYYYYPNGKDLYSKVKITKGDYAYDLIKPEGYTKGYEWSPKPSETVMDAHHNFTLVPSEGTDINESYKVSYYYSDGVTLFKELEIATGTYAPNLMMPAGYTRCVWSPSPTETAITRETRFTMVAGSTNANDDSDSSNNGGNSSNSDGAEYFTLSVVNGSGSGTYKAGSQAIIVANEPANGLQFGSWTISPDNAVIASKGLSATVITMPSENVTVTANYITKTSGNNNGSSNSNNSNNNSGSNSNGNSSNGNTTPTGTKTSSGTTVVIDKNGLSNTGVVSAVVNGSSDNFTIKISGSSAADEAALKALMAAYGDISKIMYVPMDISLYDASGEKKITDTSGLTVTITIPIPDSMIQYAGNNKVAAIVNNQLDSLSPKFTTINGVSCMTFTCTHFSPYVIYVNTENITALGDNSGPSDATPKTGDGIKPKWFLAIGLAAIGVFFFVWNDRKKKAVKSKA